MNNNFHKANKLTDGPTSIFIAGEADELREAMHKKYSVSTIEAVPKSNIEKLIYSQFEQYCNFAFCEKIEDYSFYSKEPLNVIAKDKNGGVYGFIGGIGDLLDDNYPTFYVSKDGKAGKIANSFMELLALVIHYPFWKDLLKYHNEDVEGLIEELTKKTLEELPDYNKVKQNLMDSLSLNEYKYTIESLFNCLQDESKFTVYSKIDNSPLGHLL